MRIRGLHVSLDIPSFSWDMFSHVVCLDQSCASKNIQWIRKGNIHKHTYMLGMHSPLAYTV